MIHLSQSHLNRFSQCPIDFQRTYLEQLSSPIHPEQLENQRWGNEFHRLMQQWEMGLPLEKILSGDRLMGQSLAALIKKIPELQSDSLSIHRAAEHRRTLQWEPYLFTVIYDLLILKKDSAEILDWKTYPKPEKPEKLLQNWQTKLYLYVLAATNSYLPEQLSMTYWFVKIPQEPQKFTITYNQQQRDRTHEELTGLLQQLGQSLEQYQTQGKSFQHLPGTQQYCKICQSQKDHQKQLNLSINPSIWQQQLSQMEEVPL